ncbi:hypothetical protein EON65_25695 [archaeon]|nr:MAG: hypothetical protein EON65_25695 [archaeon]
MSKAKGPPGKTEAPKVEPEVEEIPIVKGSGSFLLPDNSTYEGEYLETDGRKIRQGQGKMSFGPELYEGGWENDSLSGEGEYRFSSGARYQGSFLYGSFHGQGEYTFPDGAIYVGSWNSGKMHGQGTYITKDKQEFGGQFVNGFYDTGKSYVSIRNHVAQM